MSTSQVELQGVNVFVNSVAMFTRHALLVLVLGLNVAINARFVHRLFAVRASNVRASGTT